MAALLFGEANEETIREKRLESALQARQAVIPGTDGMDNPLCSTAAARAVRIQFRLRIERREGQRSTAYWFLLKCWSE
jgi:hypothetical protein